MTLHRPSSRASCARASLAARTPFRRYSGVLLSCVFGVLGLVLALNAAVDPLWHLSGNRLTGVNHTLNERLSKTNLWQSQARRHDCVVLGSSRVTLLDASAIQGRNCFNYSFAFGHVREFLPVADHVLREASGLELVVIGVDAFNFSRDPLEVKLPDWLVAGASGPGVVSTYLSLDALRMTYAAVFGGPTTGPRYYSEDFRCDLLDRSLAYAPPDHIDLSDPYGTLPAHPTNVTGPFDVDRSPLYQELRERLAEIPRVVGYVPPVSQEFLANVHARGHLDGYLDAILSVAALFDRYYDFSFPSPVTADRQSTYDGSHYHVKVNQRIAEVLGGAALEPDFGADVHAFDPEEYRERFRAGVERFMAQRQLEIVAQAEPRVRIAALARPRGAGAP